MRRSRVRRGGVGLTIAVALSVGLSACVLLEGPTPVTPERTLRHTPQPPSAPDDTASEAPSPGPSAVEVRLRDFTAALDAYASSADVVQGEGMVNALAAAGFDTSMMQVSFDRTLTELVADSIYISVRIDGTCLLGQIVTDTHELATSIAPAVGPNGTVCLIGKTRPIDW